MTTYPVVSVPCPECGGDCFVDAVTEREIMWPDATAFGCPLVECPTCAGEGRIDPGGARPESFQGEHSVIDYRVGDGRALIADVPDGSVHLIATSPPFLALRSYLSADHEHKHAEIGSESNPAAFLDTLLGLTAEWRRVLAPWGSIAIELGDTYAGDDRRNSETVDAKTPHRSEVGRAGATRANVGRSWPRAKSLALIPQLYATSLAYGRNLLTGQPSPAGQWLVRNVIVWHRPNPAVGALGDKYRPSTSYIVVATRSPKRWFDLSAVRGEPSPNAHARTAAGVAARATTGKTADKDGNFHTLDTLHSTAGAPPLDCWFDHDDHDTWTITTQPSRLAHYAMWPAKLAERMILSMCPEWVCAACGEPRRRMESYSLDSWRDSDRPQTRRAVELADAAGLTDAHVAAVRAVGISGDGKAQVTNTGHGKNRLNVQALYDEAKAALGGYVREFCVTSTARPVTTWSTCGHDNYQPGVVLDPFAGTGTTLAVADLHHRHGIGFDLDPRNALLVEPRRAEVARNLFGTTPEIPGQLAMEIPA